MSASTVPPRVFTQHHSLRFPFSCEPTVQRLKPETSSVPLFRCDLFIAEHAERYQKEQINQKAETTGYVAYYRVSTDKQGKSGLGLEAQRAAVKQIARNAPVLGEFIEVETAKKSSGSNRPQLLAAIEEAKKRTATLLIAKLDRVWSKNSVARWQTYARFLICSALFKRFVGLLA